MNDYNNKKCYNFIDISFSPIKEIIGYTQIGAIIKEAQVILEGWGLMMALKIFGRYNRLVTEGNG